MATRQQILRVRILRMSRVLADAFSAHFMLVLWLARLADIRQAVLRGLTRLDDIRRAVLRGLTRLADICQAVLQKTHKRRVWRVLCEFSKSGESGKFGECRLDRFMHIKYVICA
jgi:hypothetical protein